MKTKLIVILGPTATGKSDLAVKIARQINGEIVSADSRQVYKGLDIGTGKITKKEMRGIQHYLLDVVDPKKIFTVADFVKEATSAIQSINDKNKIPIICGGTGFYIQALVDGLILPSVLPNKILRKKLEKIPTSELVKLLNKLDSKRSEAIDKNNRQRLIRAIEIATKIGKVPPLHAESKYEPFFIGLTCSNEILRERIHKRLVDRIASGMISEIHQLHHEGLSWKRLESLGLEYRYVSRFLRKTISRSEMIEQLDRAIYQYARRQMTWFKRDKRINWFTVPINSKNYQSLVRSLSTKINKITP